MKKYKEYMDGVRASDTLHQRLLGLEASGKRPIPWKRYGSIAAALALVVGLGAWGLGKAGGWAALAAHFQPASVPEIIEEGIAAESDIALMKPGDVIEPGEKTIGGYEVISGSGENAMATYYVLPYIEYGEAGGSEAASQISADWDIPNGAARRDLTQDEIIALMGGEDAVDMHLDWGEYDLSGWAAWYEDGSFWGAYLHGNQAHDGVLLNHFEFAVTGGYLPPTCIVYPDSVTQEVRGLTINAVKYCTPTAVSVPAGANAPEWTNLVVSFMKDDYGYRFEMSSTDAGQAELLVSRLVCCAADNRLDLSVVGGTIPAFVPDYDPAYEDGVSGDGPDICGYPLYDPNEAADPAYNAPAPRDGSSIDVVGSIAPSLYQSEPPTLRVLSSEGLVDGRSGNYTWSYTDLENGGSASVVACGPHPLDFWDAPSLTTADGKVRLNFFDLPDRVSVVCWPDSARGDTSAASQTANAVRGDQTYELTLKDGGWIYEISAGWDGQGTASYVFYLVKS